MISVDKEFIADKMLEIFVYLKNKSVDIVLSSTKMLEDAEDMEIVLDSIKASKDDGTEICNVDNVIQYAITKELKDVSLTGNNTVYILDNKYDEVKANIPYTLTENKDYLNINGVSEYDKYLNLMEKIIPLNPHIDIFYSNYIEIGNRYISKSVNSNEKMPVSILIYDKEYPEDDNESKLLAVIVTSELNGINNNIYQIERGV